MKGMVLAAGFGTRLRPLTELLPKPMFPAANRPLIDYALFRLTNLGITNIAVNLHWLPDPIRKHLRDSAPFGANVTFSEEPMILGTGGGIKAVREWVRDDALCITNGDTILLSDLAPVVRAHENSNALATMAVLPVKETGRFSPVFVDEEGHVVGIGEPPEGHGKLTPGIFAGFHIIDPVLFDLMPAKDYFCIVQDVYLPLIRTRPGAVAAQFVDGDFFDMGTPLDYLDGNMAILQNHLNKSFFSVKGMRHLGDEVYVGDSIHLGRGVNLLGPCIIGSGARIEGGSQIGPNSVVGRNAYLGAWAKIIGSVVWPNTIFPGGGQHVRSILYDRQTLQPE